MKRVMCLYRVSTKGQVDPQDDIPMQRRECLDFISRQPEWKFTGELMEKGDVYFKQSPYLKVLNDFLKGNKNIDSVLSNDHS